MKTITKNSESKVVLNWANTVFLCLAEDEVIARVEAEMPVLNGKAVPG